MIVTGASGFVGQNILKFFHDQQIDVYALSLRKSDWKEQMKTLPAIAIIHLAGKAHDTSKIFSSEEYFKVNRDLSISLFEEFLESNIRDFFYFSSVKAVADSLDSVLTEEVVGNPITPYGKSKLEAEQYLLGRELPEGKRLFIIRPCMIHGPGNKGNLNLLYQVVKRGLPWPLAAFDNQRSFLSIDNLNYLMQKIIEAPEVTSGIYNFSDDESLSTNDLVTIIGYSFNKSPRLYYISPRFIRSCARIGDFIPLPLNSERLKKLTESYIVSNAKIKKALGIDRLPVTAKEGLIITSKSFCDKN